MSFTFFGITFYLYGLILGIAIVLAISAIENKAKKYELNSDYLWRAGMISLLSGLIGARLWHVATDYHLYVENWNSVFKIWNGGLSILGGLVGGVLGIIVARRLVVKKQSRELQLAVITDLAVFGLPIAQGIGRLANYFNQELYGLPTNLPWKIYISPANRLPGYQEIAYYHPLFFYEMIPMLAFAAWVWWYDNKNNDQSRKLGTGFLTWLYLGFYIFVRYFIDFLRLEKTMVSDGYLGVNQLLLLIGFFGFAVIGWKKNFFSSLRLKLMTIICLILLVLTAGTMIATTDYKRMIVEDATTKSEQKTLFFQVGESVLQVEAVSSPEELEQGLSGRNEIGSDGMLFILPTEMRPVFWMKDMDFDLDIIWIYSGKVVDISHDVPKPEEGMRLDELPRYFPNGIVDMVLELPAGKVRELDIKVGSAAALVKNP